MMKIIMMIIIVAAGLVAYNYFTTGELSLIPSSALSAEEQEVKSLADSFHQARKMVKQAQRSAAVGGIGNIDIVADEMNAIDQVESDLVILMDSLETDSAIEKAEQLGREIEEFKRGR
jgi:hypothetical protein